jgi:hypothetical protein
MRSARAALQAQSVPSIVASKVLLFMEATLPVRGAGSDQTTVSIPSCSRCSSLSNVCCLSVVDKALWVIERNSSSELNLTALAEACGVRDRTCPAHSAVGRAGRS